MLRPRTLLVAQLVSVAAAGAIAWASVTNPTLALSFLGLAYVALGLLALGAVWHHLRNPREAPRCRACGTPRDRFASLSFCHACGTPEGAAADPA